MLYFIRPGQQEIYVNTDLKLHQVYKELKISYFVWNCLVLYQALSLGTDHFY